MSATPPARTSTPARVPSGSAACAARRRVTASAASTPAFSQMVAGSARSAAANPSMARDRLPGVVDAAPATACAMRA